MNDFIDLPHLPECLLDLPLETIHEIHSHTYHAIKADRQQRGEPIAWVSQDVALGQSVGGRPRRIWWENNTGVGIPIYTAPQPAEINIDYKALYEKMCERCDYLDAKMAEYSEQPDTPAQEPSDNEMEVIWDQIHASFGREPFRVSHVNYSRALLARYGNHHIEQSGVPEGWKLVPVEPDTALLVSMATCLYHGFGLLDEGRQDSMLHDMRKLHEEVLGKGYYSPENRERYLSILTVAPKFGEEG